MGPIRIILRRAAFLAAITALASVAPLTAGVLQQEYTLGRFVGGSIHSVLIDDQLRPANGGALLDQPELTILDDWTLGTEDVLELTLPLSGSLGSSTQELPWQIRGHGLEFRLRPNPGVTVGLSLETSNLWLAGDFDQGPQESGMQKSVQPWRSLAQSVSLDWMTREGRIGLEQPEYDLAFYFGPTLESGQSRFQFRFDNAYTTDGVRMSGIPLSFQHGIARHLEATWSLAILDSTAVTQLQGGPWTGDADYSLRWQFSRFLLRGTYGQPLWAPGLDTADPWHASAEAALVLFQGKRLFSEVQGNWDHSFSRTAPAGQLVLQASGATSDQRRDDPLLMGNLLLGLPASLAVRAGAQRDTLDQLHLGLGWSTLPLRTVGPRQSRAMDYLFGQLPGPGQLRLDAEWSQPLDQGGTGGWNGFGALGLTQRLVVRAAFSQAGASLQDEFSTPFRLRQAAWRDQGEVGLLLVTDHLRLFGAGLLGSSGEFAGLRLRLNSRF